MGHKGPVKGLRATGPKWVEIIYYSILLYSILFYSILFYSILFYSVLFYSILFYSILFYNAGLFPFNLFVAVFSPSLEPKASKPSLSPVNRFLKGNLKIKTT